MLRCAQHDRFPIFSHLQRETSTPYRLFPVPYSLFPKQGAYNSSMESFVTLVLFLVVWFLVLPRIPGISRFT
jgi:hypothetical protein